MTAITHLDANKPINEEIIDVYAALSRKIVRLLNKTSSSSSSVQNKASDDRKNVSFDYNDFKKALAIVNLNVLESRAMALFNAAMVDEKSNSLSRTELEIALMINDCYPTHSSFHSYYEMFASFDLNQCGRLNFEQFRECLTAFLLEEGRDPADTAYLAYLFRKVATEDTRPTQRPASISCRKFDDRSNSSIFVKNLKVSGTDLSLFFANFRILRFFNEPKCFGRHVKPLLDRSIQISDFAKHNSCGNVVIILCDISRLCNLSRAPISTGTL